MGRRISEDNVPPFLKRIREKRKASSNKQLANGISQEKRIEWLIYTCILMVISVCVLAFSVLYIDQTEEDELSSLYLQSAIIRNADFSTCKPYFVENENENESESVTKCPACPACVRCPTCESKEGVLTSFSRVILEEVLGEEPTQEQESILGKAISDYVSGVSQKAGAATFDAIVQFFRDSETSDGPSIVIYFDVDRFNIPRSGTEKLVEFCEKFSGSSKKIEIHGFADLTGNERRNLTLAKDRQETVRQWITSNCRGFEGEIELNGNYSDLPVKTVSDISEPENRVVIIKM